MLITIACSVAPPRCIALAPRLCTITDVRFQSVVGLLSRVPCSTDDLHRAFVAVAGAAADSGGCSSSEESGSEPADNGRVARGEKACSTAPHAQPGDPGLSTRCLCAVGLACPQLSMLAIDTSVPIVAEALLQNESRVLVKAVKRVPKGDLFQGGQRPFFWWAPWFGNGGAEVRQRARH